MPVPIPIVQAAIGAVCVLVGTPLWLGLVGRNRYFGIRVREAMASEANWRAINAFAGCRLALFGVLLLAVGLLLGDALPPPTSAWSPLILIASLAPLAAIVASIRRFAARLPER